MKIDLEYVKSCDKFINEAMAIADKKYGTRPLVGVEQWGNRWNKCYHTTMNKLCKDCGRILAH